MAKWKRQKKIKMKRGHKRLERSDVFSASQHDRLPWERLHSCVLIALTDNPRTHNSRHWMQFVKSEKKRYRAVHFTFHKGRRQAWSHLLQRLRDVFIKIGGWNSKASCCREKNTEFANKLIRLSSKKTAMNSLCMKCGYEKIPQCWWCERSAMRCSGLS